MGRTIKVRKDKLDCKPAKSDVRPDAEQFSQAKNSHAMVMLRYGIWPTDRAH